MMRRQWIFQQAARQRILTHSSSASYAYSQSKRHTTLPSIHPNEYRSKSFPIESLGSSAVYRRWESTFNTPPVGNDKIRVEDDDNDQRQQLAFQASWETTENSRTEQDWRNLAIYFVSQQHHHHQQQHEKSLMMDAPDYFLQQWAATIRFWSNHHHQHEPASSREGIDYSFVLLDGLISFVHDSLQDNDEGDHMKESVQEVLHKDPEHRLSMLMEHVLLHWSQTLTTTTTKQLPPPPPPVKEAGSEQGEDNNSTVDPWHPARIFELLQKWRNQGMTLQPHTYLILMQTALDTAQQSPAEQWHLPLFFEEIISYMLLEQLPGPGHLAGARPGVDHYVLLLKAWAESGRNDRIARGVQTISLVQELFDKRMIHFRPNTRLYNALLELLASSQQAKDVRNAEGVFHDMERGFVAGVSPDKISYRIIFYGLANIIDKDADAKDRAMVLLREMERGEEQHEIVGSVQHHRPRAQLDAAMYGYLILKLSHARHYEQAEHVHERFLSMQKKFELDFSQDDYHVKRALCYLYARTGRPGEAQKLVLDMEDEYGTNGEHSPKRSHYEFVLESWAISESEQADQQTVSWIRHLESLVTTHNAQHLVPRRWCIIKLLERLEKNVKENAAHKADLLFRALVNLEMASKGTDPIINHDHYNRMIQIWSRSQDKDAPRKAESLLLEMQKRFKNGERALHPRTSHFTGVINAWSRSLQPGSLVRAAAIFNFVRQQYLSGSQNAVPDVVLFGSMINAYARAREVDNMEKVASLMVDDYLGGNKNAKPNTTILNSMVLSVLLSKVKQQSKLNRADRIMSLMEKVGVQPDERTNSLLDEIKTSKNASKQSPKRE